MEMPSRIRNREKGCLEVSFWNCRSIIWLDGSYDGGFYSLGRHEGWLCRCALCVERE